MILISETLLLIQSRTSNGKASGIFGYKIFCIISGSMEPNIHVYDIVIIKTVEENALKEGDIIAFTVDGDTITHRIKEIIPNREGNLYVTKGDANNSEDSKKVTFEEIEGVCVKSIPKVGYIAMLLQTKSAIAIAIILVLVIYFSNNRTNKKKEHRTKVREDHDKKNR